jgi:hypothetical protein
MARCGDLRPLPEVVPEVAPTMSNGRPARLLARLDRKWRPLWWSGGQLDRKWLPSLDSDTVVLELRTARPT